MKEGEKEGLVRLVENITACYADFVAQARHKQRIVRVALRTKDTQDRGKMPVTEQRWWQQAAVVQQARAITRAMMMQQAQHYSMQQLLRSNCKL